MKIVYCILGTFNSGGMERVLANKANYLAKLGHDITLITTDQNNRKPYFLLDTSIDQIDLRINYTENNDAGLFEKVKNYPKKQKLHKKLLIEQLNRIKPDITVSMFDHEVSLLPKINDGSKKIVEVHFSRFKRLQYGRKGLWRLIDKIRSFSDLDTVRKYDKFIVLTQEDKKYWGDIDNIAVIPNANSFLVAEPSPLDSKVVIAVGRYDHQKRFEELIEIWSEVHKSAPEWKLNIFGKGPDQKQLQELIYTLDLSSSVKLRAPVQDIKNQYLNSSIIVLTSRYEGLPMALLEGQASGLPMVSYNCKCGPSDIIQKDVNGFLIEEGNKSEFVEKLILLIKNNKLRDEMGRNSFDLSKNFSEEVIMDKWLELFKEML